LALDLLSINLEDNLSRRLKWHFDQAIYQIALLLSINDYHELILLLIFSRNTVTAAKMLYSPEFHNKINISCSLFREKSGDLLL
jgi:hypothetical protein